MTDYATPRPVGRGVGALEPIAPLLSPPHCKIYEKPPKITKDQMGIANCKY